MIRTSSKIRIAKIIYKLLYFLGLHKLSHVKRQNILWKLDLSEGIDLSIFLFGSFQGEITNAIIKVINIFFNKKKSIFFLDVGSNIGDKSLSLASKLTLSEVNKFKIYSFEPTDFAYKKQKQNINLNLKLKKKISLFKYFISKNKTKPDNVYSSWKLNGDYKTHKLHKGSLKSINSSTKVISLDNFIKKKKISGQILIKIDVDGFEMNVLESCKNSLKNEDIIIFMEYAPYALKENASNKKKFFNFIKKYNYSIYDLNLKKINKIDEKYGASIEIILMKKKFSSFY